MITIVMADDHRILRQGVSRMLEADSDFKILGQAADGLEALKLVTELKPDVLVTDLRMPEMDGVELTRKVKEAFPEIKIVILSMYRESVYVYSALMAGASGFVLKEQDIEDLDTAIKTVMQGEKYLSPAITRKKIDAYCTRNNKPLLSW